MNMAFEQFQKYERGANLESSSRLWVIRRVLDVLINDLFSDI